MIIDTVEVRVCPFNLIFFFLPVLFDPLTF